MSIAVKEKIRSLSWKVYDLQSEYIKVHNKLYRETGTFRSLIKNILGLWSFDYDRIFDEVASIFHRLIAELNNIEYQKKAYDGQLADDERELLDCLLAHSRALINTVKIFMKIVHNLRETSHSFKKRTMRWNDYHQMSAEYQQSIDEYKQVGAKLNSLYKKVINNNDFTT